MLASIHVKEPQHHRKQQKPENMANIKVILKITLTTNHEK